MWFSNAANHAGRQPVRLSGLRSCGFWQVWFVLDIVTSFAATSEARSSGVDHLRPRRPSVC